MTYKISYHRGQRHNDYCAITAFRKRFVYDIDGIPKVDRNNQSERQHLLIQIIGRNTGIYHTHVILLAQDLGRIAKKTIEKELENLSELGFLESEKEGDNTNAIRKWSIKPSESDLEKFAKNEVIEMVNRTDRYVTKIEKIYPKLNDVQKALAMKYLLHSIHSFEPIIEVCNQEFKIKKEKKQFEKLLERTYQILWKEPRDYVDGRPVLRRLLHLEASLPMINMNKFLDEIK